MYKRINIRAFTAVIITFTFIIFLGFILSKTVIINSQVFNYAHKEVL